MNPSRRLLVLLIGAGFALGACAAQSGGDRRANGAGSKLPTSTVAADPSVFDYDAGAPLDATSVPAEGTDAAALEEITYTTFDGATVPALLALPTAGDGPFPCIVTEGGFGSDRHAVGFEDAVSRGFGVFSIDQRNAGDRGIEADLEAAGMDPDLLLDMLRGTVIDLRRGLDYLETRVECDPDRIGYLGFSFGGFIGSLLAGADERVQAPVLVVSGADWQLFIEESDALLTGIEYDPQAAAHAVEVLDPIDPKRWVGRISPRPVLMIWGNADEAIPPVVAKALHDAANEPKTVLEYDGGHALEDPDAQVKVFTAVNDWFDEHLGSRS